MNHHLNIFSAFRRTQCENPLSTVLNIFRDALDRKERNNSVTVFGIPGDLPKCEIDKMFDRICFALQINYKIRVTLEKIKNMLIYKFCCRRHRDHFFYNFQEFKLTGSCIGLLSNANLYCFENMASKMYNLSREIHDRHQRKEIKKYLRHQGLIYVWSNNNNARHPKLFYFMEELHLRKENVIRLLNSKILFSKIVDNFFPEKLESVVNMRHSKYIQHYLRPEICVKYYPISSIVDYIDQEDSYRKDGAQIFNIFSFYNFRYFLPGNLNSVTNLYF